MFYYLTAALRRRLILELQDSFSRHPVYRKIVPYIQNRFSFDERPQFGIVVKSEGGNKVQFSPDNYIGQVHSHVMLAYVDQPQFPVEWIREDLRAVREHGGMPTPPGVYFIEVLKAPQSQGDIGEFVVDPLITVTNEAVLLFQSGVETEGQLQTVPVQGTVRMFENGRFMLKEGRDYEISYTTGAVTLKRSFGPGAKLSADYRYATESIGPVPFTWNSANYKTLPGVVLAFGKRAEVGQKIAVVVYQDRVQAAEAYGGKFEVSFTLDILARDTNQIEELTDLTMMYLWAQKKSILELEGIEIADISIGGETEEPADETGQEFFYTTSMSVQLRADWEMHQPMPLTISKVTPLSDDTVDAKNNLRTFMGRPFYNSFPILVNRNSDFERIT